MGRPRKPTKVLELNGAFAHDPQRRRDPEPEPTGLIGAPPEHLTPGAKKAWGEIAKSAGSWLTDADRPTLEVAAVLMDQFRRGELLTNALASLRGSLGALGLDPGNRSKISVVKDKPKSQFADLAAESATFVRPN